MSFFQPTEEEIKSASSGDFPKFKSGEEVHFLITEVSESNKDGKDMLVVACEVLNTEHKGKKYKHFIRSNAAGWGIWMSILNTFLTEDQIKAGIQPSAPIGRKVSSVAKVSAREGKEYVNFYTFAALDTAPSIGGAAPVAPAEATQANNIPF
jgi:ribosomal protein L19